MSISASQIDSFILVLIEWYFWLTHNIGIPVCLQDSEGVAVLDDVPSDRTGHQRRGVKG